MLIKNSCVIRDMDSLRKLGKKPQMINRDTWKVIESLQLHINALNSLEYFILTFLLHEALNSSSEQA